MRVVLFGTGKYYSRYKNFVKDDIVALLDNNKKLQGTVIDKVSVHPPEDIVKLEYDLIIISSMVYIEEIRCQLRKIGVPDAKVCSILQYLGKVCSNFYNKYNAINVSNNGKKVVVVSGVVENNGGALAIVNAAYAIAHIGCRVTFCAPLVDREIIDEMTAAGINVIVSPGLFYPSGELLKQVDEAELAFVNSYQMLRCATILSEKMRTILWLHDNENAYRQLYKEYATITEKELDRLDIYGVSKTAVINFNKFYPNQKLNILNYWIPDSCSEKTFLLRDLVERKKIIFAIVGSIQERKAQDLFIQSADYYNKNCCIPAEFKIIGSPIEKSFYLKIKGKAENVENITFSGGFDNRKIAEIYKNIDVVVCCSRAECLPTVVNEGLMFGKIVLVTDTAGDNDHIIEGVNGFSCVGNDPEVLAKKMIYIAEHFSEMKSVRMKARQTYLERFNRNIFEKNIRYITKTSHIKSGDCSLKTQ